MLLNEWLVLGTPPMLLSSDDFFSMLIDDAALVIPPADEAEEAAVAVGRNMLPARNEVFGGLVSHFVVLWISITYLLPHGHLISEIEN